MFMDNVLTLENKMATGEQFAVQKYPPCILGVFCVPENNFFVVAENGVSSNNAANEDLAGAELHKANQERLLACLNTLTLFSKVGFALRVSICALNYYNTVMLCGIHQTFIFFISRFMLFFFKAAVSLPEN